MVQFTMSISCFLTAKLLIKIQCLKPLTDQIFNHGDIPFYIDTKIVHSQKCKNKTKYYLFKKGTTLHPKKLLLTIIILSQVCAMIHFPMSLFSFSQSWEDEIYLNTIRQINMNLHHVAFMSTYHPILISKIATPAFFRMVPH